MLPPFALPPGQCFTCSQCGDCCRTFNVALGPGEAERLATLDWRGKADDLVGAQVIVATQPPSAAAPPRQGAGLKLERLARRADGACVFLGTDQRCRLHQHFGEATKPLVCRLYPFAFYPLAGQLAVDVAWSCRAVAAEQGAPLATREPEWTRLLTATGGVVSEQRHHLAPGKAISGELLWEIEHQLLAFLDERSLSFLDRLRCALEFVRLAVSGDPAKPTARTLRLAIAKGLPRQIGKIPRGAGMDRTQRAIFYSWLFLALNPMPPNLDLASPKAPGHAARLAAGNRFRDREGQPWIDGQELPVDWDTIAAVDAAYFTAHDCPALERYCRARVIGQRFLLAPDGELPLTVALPALLLFFPMAIWTARALAAIRGAAAIDDADVRGALRLLDRGVGQLSPAALPPKVAKACTWVMTETNLVVAAVNELVGFEEGPMDELLPA
jgi:lysine-N-methylase